MVAVLIAQPAFIHVVNGTSARSNTAPATGEVMRRHVTHRRSPVRDTYSRQSGELHEHTHPERQRTFANHRATTASSRNQVNIARDETG